MGAYHIQKITVMGLGLLGRGIGDVRYLAQCGAELIVTDLKSREELAPALAELSDFPHITYVLGEHRLEDFRDRDLILKAALRSFTIGAHASSNHPEQQTIDEVNALYTAEYSKN